MDKLEVSLGLLKLDAQGTASLYETRLLRSAKTVMLH
jgi:hypothetical protein